MNPKQLPDGWHMVKFGEMAMHISKRVEPSETDLDIYVGLEHLDPDSLRIKRHGVPGDVAGQKLLVKKGQIIFGKRRAYQRKLGVADWDCICSAHAMVLEANPENVLPEFLPFFMQSDVFMNRAVAISEGSLSPTIKWKTLAEQSFRIPNLPTQKLLLGILLKIEDVLTKNDNVLSALDQLNTNISDSAFGYKSIDKNIVSGSLKDLATVENGFAFKSNEFGLQGIPVIRISDILSDGSVSVEGAVRIQDNPKYKKYSINNGDILIAMSGATTGKTAIYSGCEEVYQNQRVGKVVTNILDDQKYVFYALRNKNFMKELLIDSIGGAQPNISPSSIENTIMTYIAKPDLRRKYGHLLSQIDIVIKEHKEKSNWLHKLKMASFQG